MPHKGEPNCSTQRILQPWVGSYAGGQVLAQDKNILHAQSFFAPSKSFHLSSMHAAANVCIWGFDARHAHLPSSQPQRQALSWPFVGHRRPVYGIALLLTTYNHVQGLELEAQQVIYICFNGPGHKKCWTWNMRVEGDIYSA